MGTWLCRRELHVMKRHDLPTVNLQWTQDGYKADGSIKWRPSCRACQGLTCPRSHDQDAIVSLPRPDGTWLPACLTCLTEDFASDAARWSPEDSEPAA